MNYKNLSAEKLELISSYCGSFVPATAIAKLLADPSQNLHTVAAAMFTTPGHLQAALDLPEPDFSTTVSTDSI